MRKLLITLTMLFAVINIMAQEHLSFKGIPIEGSMTAFCQKLKAKGFTQMGRDNNVTMFTGDFTGRQATVGVGATDDGKSVHSVVVIFDESSEWNTLVNTYDYYKGLYIRKYGEPSACREHKSEPPGQQYFSHVRIRTRYSYLCKCLECHWWNY